MEAVIDVIWDEEAGVWVASNDEIPLTLEGSDYNKLMERTAVVAKEIAELNGISVDRLSFVSKTEVRISA